MEYVVMTIINMIKLKTNNVIYVMMMLKRLMISFSVKAVINNFVIHVFKTCNITPAHIVDSQTIYL
jgi:hypothetical protein